MNSLVALSRLDNYHRLAALLEDHSQTCFQWMVVVSVDMACDVSDCGAILDEFDVDPNSASTYLDHFSAYQCVKVKKRVIGQSFMQIVLVETLAFVRYVVEVTSHPVARNPLIARRAHRLHGS